MDKQKNRIFQLLPDVIALFVIALLMAAAVLCFDAPKKHYSETAIDLMTQWQADDGTVCSLNDLPKGDLVLTRGLSDIDTKDQRLCLKSIDTFFTVSADGTVIYTYAPEQPKFLGISYGMDMHMIVLPTGTRELTLSVHPLFSDTPAAFKDAAVEDAGLYMGDMYKKALPDFSVCLIMFMFGLIMLFIGITARDLKSGDNLNFFALGTFAILVGLWSINETYLLQVLTRFPALIKFMNYMCLIFIAYLPVSFTASATNHKNTVLLKILQCLITANFLITLVLNATGICDIYYLLPLSQAIIVVAVLMTVYLIIRAVRKKSINRQFARTLVFGMGAAVIGVIIDLIRYIENRNGMLGTSAFTRIGVLLFLLVVGIYLIRERNRLTMEHDRAQLMEKMAYTDCLTELKNRIAFSEKENEIRDKAIPAMIVQFDINLLKKVNDVYGHAAGDRHIIAAAHILRDSFVQIGTCYRTGGDEFIVVAEQGGENETEQALAEMQKMVDEYNEKENPPVLLQIAYGYAPYEPPNELTEAERLADQRMYDCKKKMKSAGR